MRILESISVLILLCCGYGLASDFVPLAPTSGTGGLTEVEASACGITFQAVINPETVRRHTNLLNPGLALGDTDGDGDIDLYICGMDKPNALYRNLGNWRFEDITEAAGVASTGRQNIGAAFVDVDGDGDQDLVTTARHSPPSLFQNNGTGCFTEDPAFANVAAVRAGATVAAADVEGDGDLDLYLCNYHEQVSADTHLPGTREEWITTDAAEWKRSGALSPRLAALYYDDGRELWERGERDVLLINDGHGRFVPAGDDAFGPPDLPPGPLDGHGLCARFCDLNLDGAPDLYVCNDFHTPDRLWLNDGHGHFRAALPHTIRHTSYSSMAVDMADTQLTGHWDFFVADMLSRDHARRKRQMGAMKAATSISDPLGLRPQVMHNTFFRNRGDCTFAEVAAWAGLKASEWTWGAVFSDVNLDGWPDLITASGMLHDAMDADISAQVSGITGLNDFLSSRATYPVLRTRNAIFLNRKDGSFRESGIELGVTREEVSGGVAIADLDGDGDEDIVINNLEASLELYRNDSSGPRIKVIVEGVAPNPQAVGARVILRGVQSQMREIQAGGWYAAGGPAELCFAAPMEWAPFTIEVIWRDGSRRTVDDVRPGFLHRINPASTDITVASPIATQALFVPVSLPEAATHRENPHDDFQSQPLLPNYLSRSGPGATFADMNVDGRVDILLGTAHRSSPVLLLQGPDGTWSHRADIPGIAPLLDTTSVLPLYNPDGFLSLVCGLSSFESPDSPHSAVLLAMGSSNHWMAPRVIPALHESAVGPLAVADFNQDGALDLFLGGRVKPGRYPEPATSRVLLHGGAVDDAAWNEPLQRVGLVSGATVADVNGDLKPDLVLALEWGPVTVLLNTGTGFTNATGPLGLAGYTGWWNGVTVADLNNDGRLDILASNWGENTKYGRNPDAHNPLEIYFGDIDTNGSFDIIEAHTDNPTHKLVPERGLSCSSRAMPYIRERTATYQSFGESDLQEIYGSRLDQLSKVACQALRHMAWINEGEHFTAAPLPVEAQMAPAMGVSAADFDGDGYIDIFLAQNFFSVQVETPRNDAGRGLLLRGHGTGRFTPVNAAESGIEIYGEQRAAATADYDQDGRTDLVVTQNDGPTVLLRNQIGKPGLRVKLKGTVANPKAIGAIVRPVVSTGVAAPSRIITAGTGYLSCDDSTVVLTSPTPFDRIAITWPDGSNTVTQVPPQLLVQPIMESHDLMQAPTGGQILEITRDSMK